MGIGSTVEDDVEMRIERRAEAEIEIDGTFGVENNIRNIPRITTVDGETAEVIANEDFPLAKKLSLTQLSGVEQVLLNISTGKADASFEEPAVAKAFLEHNKGTIEMLKMSRSTAVSKTDVRKVKC